MPEEPPLKIPKVGYREFKHYSELQNMRNQFGLGLCIAKEMDLFYARQMGKRSLVSSNTMMEDVITGHCYTVDFKDVYGKFANKEIQKVQTDVKVKDSVDNSPTFIT